jgi:hypothetical protein
MLRDMIQLGTAREQTGMLHADMQEFYNVHNFIVTIEACIAGKLSTRSRAFWHVQPKIPESRYNSPEMIIFLQF